MYTYLTQYDLFEHIYLYLILIIVKLMHIKTGM